MSNSRVVKEEKEDIQNIKKLLSANSSEAKEKLKEMLEKWPNSVALKRLNQVYFSPISIDSPAVNQFANNNQQFFHRLQNLRTDLRTEFQNKKKPSMFVEFGNGNSVENNSRDRQKQCKPNGDMLIETTKLQIKKR